MKRALSAAIISLLFIIGVNDSIAIPTFGTLMPKKGEYQAGVRTDIIFDRDVHKYKSAEITAYYYKMSYGFTDWFCFDGVVGTGNVRAKLKGEKKLRYTYHFSGGYGWRAKIYKNEKRGVDWVWGFQHVSTHPTNQWYRGKKHKIIWDDWQLSTVVSKRIWKFTPYCGMKWSFVYLISKIDRDYKRRLSNGPPVGLVVGTDMRLNDYLYLNVESRLFDETALNAGFTVRY